MVAEVSLPLVDNVDVVPSLGSHLHLYMLESFAATVKLTSCHPPEQLQVEIWTNTLTKFDSEGGWYSIPLGYQGQQEDKLVFQGSFFPTSAGEYQFTYRVGSKENSELWQWLGDFGENGYLHVQPPSDQMNWTQGPSYKEFLPGVYVGNFIAASQAAELPFDAVLNLAAEFDLNFAAEEDINYHKIALADGAGNPISEEALREAINWIDSQLQEDRKVLINCRAGIGRSGSVGVAYCYYRHPHWSYEQTLQYMWSKKADIYPHRQLEESLTRLFPREV